ncbi:unnamed protein product [Amoebophrya sp. A25]|nr:unnamed protein product [Amoebophrya sp. A25]|eukprot:GSA25T00015782001.1
MSASILAQAASLLKPGERIAKHGEASGEASSSKPEAPKRICDAPAILLKRDEIKYKPAAGQKHVPWIETLAVTAAKPLDKTEAEEDVKREQSFLAQAKELVAEGYRRLRVMKIPATRPDDFLAEMFKTDDQMLKVRTRIVDEQKRIGAVEERKRNQANAKFGKAVGVKRAEEKAKKRKQGLDQIEKWKSDKDKDSEGKSLEDVLSGVKSKQKKEKGKGKKGGGKKGPKKGGGKSSAGKGSGKKGKGNGKGAKKGGKKRK